MSTPALNPLVEKIRGAHPGVYDDMDDATLTKRVLAKYPQYSDLAAPSVPKPQVNMQEAPPAPPFDIGDFSSRVGERIKQNVGIIPNIIKGQGQPGAAHAAQEVAGAPLPGTLAGAVARVTGSPGLGKAVGVATIGPRLIGNMLKGYAENPASLAGDVVLASPELSEARMPANRQAGRPLPTPPEGILPTAEAPMPKTGLSPEQQTKFQAQIDKANAPLVKYQQAQDIASRMQQQSAVIQQEVKAKNAQVYGDLSSRADQMRDATENVTRPTTNIEKAIESARTDLSGVPSDLRIFGQVMKAIDVRNLGPQAAAYADALEAGEPMSVATKAAAAATEAGPAVLPFRDLQRQYTAISNAWADEAPGNIKRVLGDVRSAYGKELQAGAESIGQGNTWSQLQKDFSQYYRDWRGQGPLAKVLKAPHADYVTPYVTGKPGNLLRETYGRYGDPASIERLQQTANPPPPPPPEITPPAPEPAKPGFIRKHVIPKLGGAAAITANLPLPGHPIINYAAGSEAARAISNRMSMPPTHEAYTRTLLDAKEGRISPGEADRRIVRAGGRVKVKPIPQPASND